MASFLKNLGYLSNEKIFLKFLVCFLCVLVADFNATSCWETTQLLILNDPRRPVTIRAVVGPRRGVPG